MTHIVNWSAILMTFIICCLLQVHARVDLEQTNPNLSLQTDMLMGHRNQNHHSHYYDQNKIQYQPQQQSLQKRLHQSQRRYRQRVHLADTLISSSTNIDDAVIIKNKTRLSLTSLPMQRKTTHLRRLSTRNNYKNTMSQRRLSNHRSSSDWNYHVYNSNSNTFETAPSLSSSGDETVAGGSSSGSGKGEDNSNDVEFISQRGTGGISPNWNNNRRRFGFMPEHTTFAPPTQPPPPLVPARRGYVTMAPPNLHVDVHHTTDKPNDMSKIDAKEMEKRHICVQHRTITLPVKTTEVYARPIWKHVNTPCSAVQIQTQHPNQMCTRVQLIHEQTYRDVIRHKSSQQVTYDCCSGWEREQPNSDACTKPVCSKPCQNGGSCIAPDTCNCTLGFKEGFCQHDVNECMEEKPCDQICINTVGSYFCKCREGFVLQADQQSCKKIDLQDEDAFEARDLENDINSSDNENMSARLQKVERSLANERVHTNELHKSLQATYSVVDTLKTRLSTIEKQQQDINRLQSNLYATETRTNKLEGMLNLLMKCRNGPNAYCP